MAKEHLIDTYRIFIDLHKRQEVLLIFIFGHLREFSPLNVKLRFTIIAAASRFCFICQDLYFHGVLTSKITKVHWGKKKVLIWNYPIITMSKCNISHYQSIIYHKDCW